MTIVSGEKTRTSSLSCESTSVGSSCRYDSDRRLKRTCAISATADRPWPATSPIATPRRPPRSGTNAYQSPPIAEPGAAFVARRELDAVDLGHAHGQERALHALDQPVVLGDAAGERGLPLLALGDVEHDPHGAQGVTAPRR